MEWVIADYRVPYARATGIRIRGTDSRQVVEGTTEEGAFNPAGLAGVDPTSPAVPVVPPVTLVATEEEEEKGEAVDEEHFCLLLLWWWSRTAAEVIVVVVVGGVPFSPCIANEAIREFDMLEDILLWIIIAPDIQDATGRIRGGTEPGDRTREDGDDMRKPRLGQDAIRCAGDVGNVQKSGDDFGDLTRPWAIEG
ncbi:hypothetical protein FRC17_003877 [Serendipita sp. 399]|nr:hypothetical protein FRC17_003877 [Serendipita sp. 399]